MAFAGSIAWVLVIFLIILVFIFVYWLFTRPPSSEFGIYAEPVVGSCMNESGLCSDPGTRTTVQECIINEQTGKGCINSDGEQTFDTIITKESCTLTCRTSVWENITPLNQPCVNPPDPVTGQDPASSDVCLPLLNPCDDDKPLNGTKELTYKCVANDPTGYNACTSLELTKLTGPTGVQSMVNQNVTYIPGPCPPENPMCDTITVTEQCAVENPICGTWKYFFLGDDQLIPNQQVTVPITPANDDDISDCDFFSSLLTNSQCTVANATNSVFDLFKEGILFEPMSCIEEDIKAVIPGINDPSFRKGCIQGKCNNTGKLITDCNITNFNPSQVANKSIPPEIIENAYICRNQENISNPRNNPICYRPCKLYPTLFDDSVVAGFAPLINNALLSYKNNFYLSAYQTPRNDGKLIKYSNQNNLASIPLDDTPLMLFPFGFIVNGPRPNCTNHELAYSTSVLMTLAPVQLISATSLKAKLQLNIPGYYNGWLANETFFGNNIATWKQSYNTYDGPGLTYDQSSEFIVNIISPFDNTPVPGYSQSIGQMTVSIKNTNNTSILTIDNNDNISNFFDNFRFIVFKSFSENGNSILNLTSRIKCGLGSCNLLYSSVCCPIFNLNT